MNTAVAEATTWLEARLGPQRLGRPGLLDTYEAEWRRSAPAAPPGRPGKAGNRLARRRWAEDLNGRLDHAWLAQANGHRRSTFS